MVPTPNRRSDPARAKRSHPLSLPPPSACMHSGEMQTPEIPPPHADPALLGPLPPFGWRSTAEAHPSSATITSSASAARRNVAAERVRCTVDGPINGWCIVVASIV